MSEIFSHQSEVLTLDDALAHTTDLMLTPRRDFYGGHPTSRGNVQLVVKFEKTVGTNSDGLAISVTPILREPGTGGDAFLPDNVSATDLETALNWTDGHRRVYDVSYINSGCPFFGVRVSATYANGVDDSEEMTVEAWLISE